MGCGKGGGKVVRKLGESRGFPRRGKKINFCTHFLPRIFAKIFAEFSMYFREISTRFPHFRLNIKLPLNFFDLVAKSKIKF